MKTMVTMTDRGRITLPVNVRKELHIEGETPFELETIGEQIIVRPAVLIPREDAWAYTPEHRAAIERARSEPAYAGVTREDLDDLVNSADPTATLAEMKERWTLHEA